MFLILALHFAAMLVGCVHDSKGWTSMDLAERLMSVAPDSALSLLKSINCDDLHSKREQARYALLMSMAMDKNCVDTTSFDILQPAIDYYLKKGSADEKLRTYYYQGRIYQNRCEYDSALFCFLNGKEYLNRTADTMTAANLLVAEATIQYRIYRLNDFIRNNLEAAKLYQSLGRYDYEVSCLGCALDGALLNNNRQLADSIKRIAENRITNNPGLADDLATVFLSYEVKYGDVSSAMDIISHLNAKDSINDVDRLDISAIYSRLEDWRNAKRYLDSIPETSTLINNLKYLAIKQQILKNTGDFRDALEAYQDFSASIDSIHHSLFSQDLLFAQKKHELEKLNLIGLHKSDRRFWIMICVALALLLATACIAYQFILSRTKNKLAEEEKIRLSLENESLKNENKNLELEKRNALLEVNNAELKHKNTILEKQLAENENRQLTLKADDLKKDNDRLESERRIILLEKQAIEHEKKQKALEAENLMMKIHELEDESAGLKEILEHHNALTKLAEEAIRVRLNTLNKLITQNIRNNHKLDMQYDQWCAELLKDTEEFMKSTRMAYTAVYPKFIAYLEQRGLTEEEIDCSCLYAIGLRGKEIGKYLSRSRHYHMSSDIRTKLGIGEHDTNLGLYIRHLLETNQ